VLLTGGLWQITSAAQAQTLESRLQMARLHAWTQIHAPKRLVAQRLVTQPSRVVEAPQKFEVSRTPVRSAATRPMPVRTRAVETPQAYRIVSRQMRPAPALEDDYVPRVVEPRRTRQVTEAQVTEAQVTEAQVTEAQVAEVPVVPEAQAVEPATTTATDVVNANSGVSIPAPSGSPDRPQVSPPATLPQSSPNGPSGTATPDETATGGASTGGVAPDQSGAATTDDATPGDVVVPESGRRPISISVDTRLGFDRGVQVSPLDSPIGPIPVAINVKRSVRSLSVAASYPLGERTSLSLGVPYISQRTESSVFGRTFARRGSGIGDVSLFLTQRFPEVSRGTEVSLSGGLIFPTGRNPFELGPNELPTGNGFYQALLRFSVSKMVVPLQFFASFDYGKSAARSFGGQRLRLPDEYGAQIGFFYTLSPEFSSQTSLSYSKQSSPFLLQPGATVAYFTQALSYTANPNTVLRSAVDVGLTEEATDAYLNFSFNRQF
jgi:hypothetical protein